MELAQDGKHQLGTDESYIIIGEFDQLVVSNPKEIWTGHDWTQTMFHARIYTDLSEAKVALSVARRTQPNDSVFPFVRVDIVDYPNSK